MGKEIKEHNMRTKKEENWFKEILHNDPEILSVITIVLVMIFSIVVIAICKTALGNDKTTITIAENSAEDYFYRKEYDKAIEEYNKLQDGEEWPLNTVKEAEVYSVKGDRKTSERLLNEAYEKRNKLVDEKGKIKYQELDGELGNYIAFTALMNGEYKKALEYGEIFLKDNEGNKVLERTLFSIYLSNGDKQKATDILKDYNLDKQQSYDLAIYGKMNLLIGDFDSAFSYFKKAWDANNDEAEVYDAIGELASNNMDDTVNRLLALAKKDPEAKAYKTWLVKCYSMDKTNSEKGLELIEQLDGEELGDSAFKGIIADVKRNLGNKQESDEIYNSIINKKDKTYVDYNIEADYYYNSKEYDKAFEAVKKSIIANRNYVNNYGDLVANIMVKKKQVEVAEPYYRTALRKEPFNYKLIVDTANYYGNIAKNTDIASINYKLAISLNPKDHVIYYNMAMVNVSARNSQEAINNLKKAIELKGNEIKYHNALSVLYYNNNKMDDAIKEIRTAYSIDKNNIIALNNAGCYYISVTGEADRGAENLLSAYQKLDANIDAETRSTIASNYEKAKEYKKEYTKYKTKATKPELQMLS